MNSIPLRPESVKAREEYANTQYRMTAAERTAQIRQDRAMKNLPYALISAGSAVALIVASIIVFVIR